MRDFWTQALASPTPRPILPIDFPELVPEPEPEIPDPASLRDMADQVPIEQWAEYRAAVGIANASDVRGVTATDPVTEARQFAARHMAAPAASQPVADPNSRTAGTSAVLGCASPQPRVNKSPYRVV